MKICYLCADPGVPLNGTKGASAHVRGLVHAFHDLGHEVIVLIAKSGRIRDLPVAVHEVPLSELTSMIQESLSVDRALTRLFHNLTVEAALKSLLEREHPHVLIERYALFSIAGVHVARQYDVPLILEVNAPLAWESAHFRRLISKETAQQLESYVWQQADAIVTVSEELKKFLVQQGISPEKVTVVPNGVDPRRFHPSVDGASMRRLLQLTGKFVIGYVGSLRPWHGLDTLSKAFRLLASDPRLHLLIVGGGKNAEAVETMLRGLAAELPGRVTLTGAVPHDEIPSYLHVMDVVVAPYASLPHFYFSPLKVIEAMACGKAVIASRLGQLTQLIEHEQTGLLVSADDAQALAAAIQELADDPAKISRLGREAAHQALAHYTWERAARQIMELAESLRAGATRSEA